MHPIPAVLALIALLAPLAVHAQTPAPQQGVRYIKTSNGTGFFVSKDGYLVTNAHVIRGCIGKTQVTSGAINTQATIIARNDAMDLALLKSDAYAPAVASLRLNEKDISQGEPVIVMGYAGQAGAQGTYSFVKSQVLGTTGPTGEAHWLQFGNAAQQGNSGGPLLDSGGHVIGVITGKTQLYRVDPRANVAPTKVGESDVAVNLTALTQFLDSQRVRYQGATTGLLTFSDLRLESAASNYIVQLRCEVQ